MVWSPWASSDAAGGAEATTVNDYLSSSSTATTTFVQQVSPDAGLGSASASVAVDTGGAAMGVASNQASASLDGADATGVAAGDNSKRHRMWIQGFGSVGDQDERDGVEGYEADTYGLAVGADRLIAGGDAVVGVSLSYAATEVDSEGAGFATSDINTYMATVYGEHRLPAEVTIDAQIGYAYNDIETSRAVTALGASAAADYESHLFMAKAGVAKTYEFDNAVRVEPRLGVEFSHVSADSYTETGAGSLNARVGSEDVSALKFSVGAKVEKEYAVHNGVLTPYLSAAYVPEVLGQQYETTASFTGGGASFAVTGYDPAQHEAQYSLGFELESGDLDILASYDGRAKADFLQPRRSAEAALELLIPADLRRFVRRMRPMDRRREIGAGLFLFWAVAMGWLRLHFGCQRRKTATDGVWGLT